MAAAPGAGARERCSWCNREVDAGDGFRLGERPGGRRAVFCRLEHVIPWAIRGASWEPGGPQEAPGPGDPVGECALCAAPLGTAGLVLVRHRGEHRIPDGFCSLDHLDTWAKAGGRWR